jgi:arylsulfatase A-like enzyme
MSAMLDECWVQGLNETRMLIGMNRPDTVKKNERKDMGAMNRRRFIGSAALAGITLGCAGGDGMAQHRSGNPNRQPNIVFVLCDDLGWGDLGCYGHPHIKTPNLDRLAAQGTMLTNFYVNSPVCSPTRAGVMTGRFPSEIGFHGHLASLDANRRRGIPNYLDPDIPTLPKLLKSAGYATAHFGKWHMGGPQDKTAPPPEDYGIDVSGTVLSNGPHYNQKGDNRSDSSMRIMQHTIDFIESNADTPFFINCWLIDPHSVLAPSPEQMAMYEDYSAPGRAKERFSSVTQTYYAVITDIDTQVGKLMDTLDRLDLADDTIVVFTSDNGPAPVWGGDTNHSGAGSVGPFRGCKASLYEGGIREPFIVRWPGKVQADAVDDTTVMSAVDLLPSFCKLAGVELPSHVDMSGEDMSDIFRGKPMERAKPLMWEYRYSPWGRHIQKSPDLAMRDGDWKLMMNPDGGRIELYNLSENVCEVDNCARENTDRVERMSKTLLAWQRSLPDVELMPESVGSFEYPWPGRE